MTDFALAVLADMENITAVYNGVYRLSCISESIISILSDLLSYLISVA